MTALDIPTFTNGGLLLLILVIAVGLAATIWEG